METKLAPNIILSDAVIRDQMTGKYTLVGTFDQFHLPSFPFQPPPFFVTVSLLGFQGGLLGYKVDVSIEKKAGADVFARAIAEINTATSVKPTDTIQVPFQLTGEFKSEGLHTVKVFAEGKLLGSRDFLVNLKSPTSVRAS